MKIPAAVLSVCTLIALPVEARDAQWMHHAESGAAWLAYGTPESDDVRVSLACSADTPEIALNYDGEPKGVEDGAAAWIEMKRGDAVTRFEGEAYFSEMHDALQVSAFAVKSPELMERMADLFGASGQLVVSIPGVSSRIPLDADARAGFAAFRTACLGG